MFFKISGKAEAAEKKPRLKRDRKTKDFNISFVVCIKLRINNHSASSLKILINHDINTRVNKKLYEKTIKRLISLLLVGNLTQKTMKKFTLIVAVIAFLLAGCSKKEEPFMILPAENVLKEKSNPAAVPDGEAYSKSKVDGFVKQTLEERNDFNWEWVELRMLWSALQSGDHSLAIGYKPAETGDMSNTIHKLNIRTAEWKSVHAALIDFIVKELSAATETPIKWKIS